MVRDVVATQTHPSITGGTWEKELLEPTDPQGHPGSAPPSQPAASQTLMEPPQAPGSHLGPAMMLRMEPGWARTGRESLRMLEMWKSSRESKANPSPEHFPLPSFIPGHPGAAFQRDTGHREELGHLEELGQVLVGTVSFSIHGRESSGNPGTPRERLKLLIELGFQQLLINLGSPWVIKASQLIKAFSPWRAFSSASLSLGGGFHPKLPPAAQLSGTNHPGHF